MAARERNRLSARKLITLETPGLHADGGGLYLLVRSRTARSWMFIYFYRGKRREAGLGGYPRVSLAAARERAKAFGEMVALGQDPLSARKREVPLFAQLCDEYMEERRASVRSDKSVARWKRCIGSGGYAEPLRRMRVDQIGTEDIVRVLQPIRQSRPTTSDHLRLYIEGALNLARVKGYRVGDNPAAWKGHLELILPKPVSTSRGHHAALPYEGVPDVMAQIRLIDKTAAKALEMTVLTACRTSEVLNAKWCEIDMQARVWVIPAARMKAGREHRVPLVPDVLVLLQSLDRVGDYVFPARGGVKPLSNMAMAMILRRLGVDATVHGFRSSFRDWAGDATDTPREVAEAALAHSVGNGAEQAYRRGDALEKRRALMEQWATYCRGAKAGLRIVA